MTADPRGKYAVIVAGGKGLRMATEIPKQFLPLAGKPVLYHTLKAFTLALPDIKIVLVYPESDRDRIRQVLNDFNEDGFILVKGGATRFDSVKNGLNEIRSPSVIFVHDGVRPLLSTDLIKRCYKEALLRGNAIPALPLKESIRMVKDNDNGSVNRENYRIIQTPQTFLSELLLPAFDRPYDPSFTDEATVVEKAGGKIHLIPGEEQNIKITHPYDLWLATRILTERNAEI
jgi:2-C-methyl-D-erythritol 4-phosphate cytidylyltransferase